APSFLQERHLAGREVVHRANQRNPSFIERLREVRTLVADLLRRVEDVLLGDLVDAGVVLRVATLRLLDGRMDLGEQTGQVAQLRTVDRPFYGAAARVPEDDDELRAHADGVLETAELVLVHDVAGDAYRKDVADALIEDDLDRRTGVHATEDRR